MDKMIHCPKCGEMISLDDALLEQFDQEIKQKVLDAEKEADARAATALQERDERHERELERIREEATEQANERSREQSQRLEEAEYQLSRANKELAERNEKHQRDIGRARVEAVEDAQKEHARQLDEANYERDKAVRALAERDEEQERAVNRARKEEIEKAERVSRERARELEEEKSIRLKAEEKLTEQTEQSKRELSTVREQAQEDAEKQYRLILDEKDEKERRLNNKIAELERQARQGSAELQGEVLEKWLTKSLKSQFPSDSIEEVKRGQYGADLVQKVIDPMGKVCGNIIWEAKRTQRWSPNWIGKVQEDATRVNAEFKVIVSEALPEDINTFGQQKGVWVSSVESAPALGYVLREHLLQSYDLRRAMEGQGQKRDAIYAYLVSPAFRDHVEQIVLAWEESEQQILKEEKAMQAQWAARRRHLNKVLTVTNNMYADIRNLIGADELPQVEALSFPELPPGEDHDGTSPIT